MKVLVTGAAGFVGRQLCNELAARSIAFVGTGRTNDDGIVGMGDLTPDTNWSEVLKDVSEVVHLAARVHVMNETEVDPSSAFLRVNVDATINLARQAARAGVKRFVFVSSIKVNGESTMDHPYTELDAPAPDDPYGTSKYLAEVALWELAKETGLEVVVVRPPLIYGPGVKANFHNLMRAVHRGIPLPIRSVRNLRSMVALDNLTDFLVTTLTHAKAAGHIFLISDDDDISTATLARKLAQAMRRRACLVSVPISALRVLGAITGKRGAVDRVTGSLQVDIGQAKTVLGWRPRVSVDQGIERTVAHFLSTRNAGR
jgi:nucleoside-diphosphate-sugar epimerase